MKKGYALLWLIGALACGEPPEAVPFRTVEVVDVLQDSTISVRALEPMEGSVGFAGSGGLFGSVDTRDFTVRTGRMEYQGGYPEFRAVAHTPADFFMLSAGDPALLYKTGGQGRMELVYEEHGPGVFYDAMAFWDGLNGLAVGDALGGCLSILTTRDGGQTWEKVPCEALPPALEGEGAFAASDTNIAIRGGECWVVTSKGRVFHSADLGGTWEVYSTPVRPESDTYGLYSLDFYDTLTGYAIGGDYTAPEDTRANKVATHDGGRSWSLRADGRAPGYRSCVQYVPGRRGRDLVAVGFMGISYSSDGGDTWTELSDEGFYSLRFVDDSTAIGSGKGRISRLRFR